jgi:transcriptional antiterminator RfaH
MSIPDITTATTPLQFRNAEGWYVIQCQPFGERIAAAVLERHLGLLIYLPELRRLKHGQVQQILLFPRYLFAHINLYRVTVSQINTVPGVLRLVVFGDFPAQVPHEVIESLRERVDVLNINGGLPQYSFKPGDLVHIKDGPLQGLDAVFVESMRSNERVQVLLSFLGHLSRVELDVEVLEPTDSPQRLSHKRGTRGKGRKINRPGASTQQPE